MRGRGLQVPAGGRGELKWGGRAAGERRGRGELSACGSRDVGCAAATTGGATQTKCRACAGEGRVKENEGGGGGGGGWLFNGASGQLKGPQAAEELQG